MPLPEGTGSPTVVLLGTGDKCSPVDVKASEVTQPLGGRTGLHLDSQCWSSGQPAGAGKDGSISLPWH